MRNSWIALCSFILTLDLSSCSTAAFTQAAIETKGRVSDTPVTETEKSISFQPTGTDNESTPTPDWDKLWIPSGFVGDHVVIMDKTQPYSYELPFHMGEFYDYSSANHRVLFALDFPDRAAGPGNASVSDLTISNFDNGEIETLIEDDIVDALWFPDGEAFAYILATDQTYELHRRSLDGVDRILAEDVTFTWSIAPSGQAVAFTRESGYGLDITPGLYVVDVNADEERMIASVDVQGSGDIMDQPYWSPDSSEVILSHWAGPEEPRLILARVDGSASCDLVLSPTLVDQWWATIRIRNIIWYPDGDRLVGVTAIGYELGGPNALVYYRIDRATNTLVDGKLLAEVSGSVNLFYWAVPGVSVLADVIGEGLIEVFVP